jgi:hypothetical protein
MLLRAVRRELRRAFMRYQSAGGLKAESQRINRSEARKYSRSKTLGTFPALPNDAVKNGHFAA